MWTAGCTACAVCAARRRRAELPAAFLLPVTSYATWALGAWTLGAWLLLKLLAGYYAISDTLGFFALSFLLVTWYLLFGALSLAARALYAQIAAGAGDEPLAKFSLNPLQEPYAAFSAMLLVAAVWSWSGDTATFLLFAAIILPLATVSVLVHDGFAGLSPQAMLQTLTGLGAWLVPSCALLGAAFWLLANMLHQWNSLPVVFAAGYGFLSVHGLLGMITFHCRQRLPVHTLHSPEQTADAEHQARQSTLDALLMDLHRLCNADRQREAIDQLESFAARDHAIWDPLIQERLRRFHHQPLRLEFAVRYLNRLVGQRKPLRGWALLLECMAEEPAFRPNSDATMYALLMAAEQRDVLHLLPLLEEFAETYAGSGFAAHVDIRRAEVHLQWLGDPATAQTILRDLLALRPDLRSDARLKRLLAAAQPSG